MKFNDLVKARIFLLDIGNAIVDSLRQVSECLPPMIC